MLARHIPLQECTGIKQGKNGFEKDKAPEGTDDTPDNPDQYKTHVTDAFDTLWLGMNFYFTRPGTGTGGIFFLNRKKNTAFRNC